MAGGDSGGFTGVVGKAVSVRCTGVSGLGGRVARVRAFYGHVAQRAGDRGGTTSDGRTLVNAPFPNSLRKFLIAIDNRSRICYISGIRDFGLPI